MRQGSRRTTAEAEAGESQAPPLTPEEFRASPEFARFTRGIKKLLKVPKAELDRRVIAAKEASPRVDNPAAPGRKPKTP
jgi:hypothetical protein